MLIVGLTGELASGKTKVLKLLKSKGAITFNADQRVHRYYRQKRSGVYKRVAAAFPESLEAGAISRKKLAKSVFSDRGKLKKLESLVHPLVIKELLEWIKKAKKSSGKREIRTKVYVAEIPLLFEKKLEQHFDLVVLVKVKRQVLIQRIMKLHKFSKAVTLRRLSLYLPLREKIKRSNFVINNSGDFKKLQKEVDLLWRKLKEK